MRSKTLRLALLILAALTLGGCAEKQQVSNREQDQANLWAEISGLKSQIQQLNARMDEITYQLKSKPQRPQAPLSESSQANQPSPGQSDSGSQSQVSRFSVDKPSSRDDDFYVHIGPGGDEQEEVQAPEDPQAALFASALKAYQDRQYQSSLAQWSEFVRRYPASAQVSTALFWQGETYFKLNDYARAVLSYQEIIDKYPTSPKYAEALLRQGASFKMLGKDNAARLILQDVIKKFPESSEAGQARTMLRELR